MFSTPEEEGFYTPPPPPLPFGTNDKPTLIVSWWVTLFATVIIALRLAGRYVRVEKLFPEDKIAAASLLPLYIRMALVHVVLLYGTNNVLVGSDGSVVMDGGLRLSEQEIEKRKIGSGLVLLSRVFYCLTLWTFKLATLQFFARLVGATGKRIFAHALLGLRILLATTFVAVLISTLAECAPDPFSTYWQVSPQAPGRCRQGFAQLLTFTVCSVTTDLCLVIFPIPIVLFTKISTGRKLLLVCLFSLGLATVAVTAFAAPRAFDHRGDQATRSTWASAVILTAVFVTNGQALGSFIRDAGAKKKKYKPWDPRAGNSGGRGTLVSGGGGAGGRKASVAVGSGGADPYGSGKSLEAGLGGLGGRGSGMDTISSGGGNGAKLSSRSSQESLIPRSRGNDGLLHGQHHLTQGSMSNLGVVMKTTKIEVTVSEAKTSSESNTGDSIFAQDRIGRRYSNGATMMLHGGQNTWKTPSRALSASARGVGRGSTKLLQEVEPLPGSGVELKS